MVRIALIDSGIDVKHFGLNIDGGISLECNSAGKLLVADDISDICGHGSACASVIIKEFPNASFFVLKIFNNKLEARYETLIAALEYLLKIDVDIINLSLAVSVERERYQEIIELTRKLHSQGKEIFWANKNGEKSNLLFSDRSFWNIGANDFVKDLFITEKDCYIDVNTLPYLHYNMDSYKLFGASTSYATAKVTGIMAKYIETYKNKNLSREKFIKHYNSFIEFEPYNLKKESLNYNTPLFRLLLDIIKQYFNLESDNDILEYSLFSSKIGKHEDFCYDLVKIIEKKFSICLAPYTSLSKLDFISIFTLYKVIQEKI